MPRDRLQSQSNAESLVTLRNHEIYVWLAPPTADRPRMNVIPVHRACRAEAENRHHHSDLRPDREREGLIEQLPIQFFKMHHEVRILVETTTRLTAGRLQ